MQQLLLLQRVPAGPDVEPAGWRQELRNDRPHAVERAVDHAGRLDRVLHALDADPHAGEARQRPAVEPVVDDLLQTGRIQDRDQAVDEGKLGLMRGGGAFAGMVVAHQREDAAMR